MRLFSNVLRTFALIAISSNQTCLAKPGDLISRSYTPPTRTVTTVETYRVTGWQDQLTQVSPNLSNYYWEPMTKRIINTTRTTQKGAITAPPVAMKRAGQYVNPTHAAMPFVAQPKPLAAVPEKFANSSTSVALKYKTSPRAVLTYQDAGRTSSSYCSGTVSTRESVYGVLKTSN